MPPDTLIALCQAALKSGAATRDDILELAGRHLGDAATAQITAAI